MDTAVKYPVHSYVVERLGYPSPTPLDSLYLSAVSQGYSHSQVDSAMQELCSLEVVSLHPDMVTYGAGSSTPFIVTGAGRESYQDLLTMSTASRALGCSSLMRHVLEWRQTMKQSTLWTCMDFVTTPHRYGHLRKLTALWRLKLTREICVIQDTPTSRLVMAV